jgi:hypothetical protein
MKSPARCPYCDATEEVPHLSEADCFRVVDRQLAEAVKHLRMLTRRKGHLLRSRIRARQRAAAVNARIGKSQKALAGTLGPQKPLAAMLSARRFSRSK